MTIAKIDPIENERNLKTSKSTIGYLSRNDLTMNVTSETTETTAKMAIVGDWNQSSRSPRSSTYCSDANPALKSASPVQSIPPFGFSINLGFGMNASVMRNATIPIGILMEKMSGQLGLSTM